MRSLARISNGTTRPRLSSLVENFFGPELTSFWDDFPVRMRVPATNIREREDDYVIEVAAPGMDKSDFQVNVEDQVLTIGYEREEKEEKVEDDYTHREFGYNAFRRSFTLPKSVDGDKVSATYKDGVLYVNLPKKEEAKKKAPRLIAVK